MEGRTLLRCADCNRTREISGELPDEYTNCFARYVREEGWVPKPGANVAFMCGECAGKYMGSETSDDEATVQGLRTED
jgi:hypothetical protein